jgi:hypothetical protein
MFYYGISNSSVTIRIPVGPRESWRRDGQFGTLVGLVVALSSGVVIGIPNALTNGIGSGFSLGVAAGLSGWLAGWANSTLVWPTTLTAIRLWRDGATPLRIVRFFEDGRERGVLRAVGPIYEFRHARLQKRLASTHLGRATVPAHVVPTNTA